MTKNIRASAPGNLFFLGEHAVVYGYPSVNVSISKRTYSSISERTDKYIELNSTAFGLAKAKLDNFKLVDREMKQQELNPLLDLLEDLTKHLDIKTGFNVNIDSEIPVESGMSSSTAVTCSMLCALSELFGQNIKKENYFDILYPTQTKIHGGMASGSEIISSSLGGFNKIQKIEKEGTTKIKWDYLGKAEFNVIIGYTNVRAPTAQTVGKHIPSLIKRNQVLVDTAFKSISYLSENVIKAIQSKDPKLIGDYMNTDQEILSKLLGLSHPKLDDCVNEARRAGALGAKLRGGGWGGVMFAIVDENNIDKIAQAIESTGAQVIKTEIGVEGARIE